MAVEYICDGCGKRAIVAATRNGLYFKPHNWYDRSDDDGTQTACSRECIKIIAEKSGKTDIVLPI